MAETKEPEKWPALVGFPFTIAAIVLIGLTVYYHVQMKQVRVRAEEALRLYDEATYNMGEAEFDNWGDGEYANQSILDRLGIDESDLNPEKEMKKERDFRKKRNWCGIGGILLLVLGCIALFKWSDQRGSDVSRVHTAVKNRDVPGLVKLLGAHDMNVSNAARDALVKMGDAVVEPMVEMLSSNNVDKRGNAVNVLSKIEDSSAVEPLIKVLEKDRKRDENSGADSALAAFGGDEAFESIVEAAGDASWEWQGSAISTLAEIKDERAIEALAELPFPADGKPDLASEALEQIGTQRALSRRIERLESWANARRVAKGGTPVSSAQHWQCPSCETILEKNTGMMMIFGDAMAGGSSFGGNVKCSGCGEAYPPGDIYSGKYDIEGEALRRAAMEQIKGDRAEMKKLVQKLCAKYLTWRQLKGDDPSDEQLELWASQLLELPPEKLFELASKEPSDLEDILEQDKENTCGGNS